MKMLCHKSMQFCGCLRSACCTRRLPTPLIPIFSKPKYVPYWLTIASRATPSPGLGGLRLDSEEGHEKGRQPRACRRSRRSRQEPSDYRRQQTDPGLKMPLGGKLSDPEIAVLEAWVKAGAVWPKNAAKSIAGGTGKYTISPERRAFWSFKPLAGDAGSSSQGCKMGEDRYRSIRAGAFGKGRPEAGGTGHQAGSDSPRDARSDRPAAHAGRNCRLRKRHITRRFCESGGPAAGFASLWGTLGKNLARRRALRRG